MHPPGPVPVCWWPSALPFARLLLGKTTTCFVPGGRVCIKRYVLLLHVSRGADIIIIIIIFSRGADFIAIHDRRIQEKQNTEVRYFAIQPR